MQTVDLLSQLEDIKKELLKEVPLTRYHHVLAAELVIDKKCKGIEYNGFNFYFNPKTYKLDYNTIKRAMAQAIEIMFDGNIINALRSVSYTVLYDESYGHKIPTLRDLLEDGDCYYPYLKVKKMFENEEVMYLRLTWQSNVSQSGNRSQDFKHGRGVLEDDFYFLKVEGGIKRINSSHNKAIKIMKEFAQNRFEIYKAKMNEEWLDELDSILVAGKLLGFEIRNNYYYSTYDKVHHINWSLVNDNTKDNHPPNDLSIRYEVSFNAKGEFVGAKTYTSREVTWGEVFSSDHREESKRVPKEEVIKKFAEFVANYYRGK